MFIIGPCLSSGIKIERTFNFSFTGVNNTYTVFIILKHLGKFFLRVCLSGQIIKNFIALDKALTHLM